MSWVNIPQGADELNEYRQSDYNNFVITNKDGMNTFALALVDFFGSITTSFENIGSILAFPLKFCDDDDFYFQDNLYIGNKKIEVGDTRTTVKVTNGTSLYEYLYLSQAKVERKYNDFRDYSPYTKLQIFLPYVNGVDINIDEVLDKVLQFRLYVDYYTGMATYIIGVTDNFLDTVLTYYTPSGHDDNMRILKTIDFQLGVEIPLGTTAEGDRKRNILLGALKTVTDIGFIASTGLSPTITTKTKTYDVRGRSTVKGSRMKPIRQGTETTTTTTEKNVSAYVNRAAFNDSMDILNGIHSTQVGQNSNAQNYIFEAGHITMVYTRPKYANNSGYEYGSAEYNHLFGRPLAQYKKLGDLSGYTEISEIHFEPPKTAGSFLGYSDLLQDEKSMIEKALYSGFIL